MSRPLLEVAYLVRAEGTAFLHRNRHWIAGRTAKYCLPLPAVAPPPTVAISMSAPAADIVPPSRTTVAATGTAPSVRPVRVNAGSRPVAGNYLVFMLPPQLVSTTGL